jgi:hypothetical protein
MAEELIPVRPLPRRARDIDQARADAFRIMISPNFPTLNKAYRFAEMQRQQSGSNFGPSAQLLIGKFASSILNIDPFFS